MRFTLARQNSVVVCNAAGCVACLAADTAQQASMVTSYYGDTLF